MENILNPFTRFLRHWQRDGNLDRFLSFWDRLESLAIQIYKEQIDATDAEMEFAQVWPWLRENYNRWQDVLEPCWRRTRVAGAPSKSDPFLLLLAIESPAKIAGDWRAMQHLPAAREAINQYLLQLTYPTPDKDSKVIDI
jgi:hypothetical protein